MQSVVEKPSTKFEIQCFANLSNLKQMSTIPRIDISILFLISKQIIYLLIDVDLRLSLQTQLRAASLRSHSCSSQRP